MLHVIEDLIDPALAADIAAALEGDGLVDGRTTAGARARRVKNNQQLGSGSAVRAALQDRLIEALNGHGEFRKFAMPRRIARPLISRYDIGMEYGLHVDNATMNGGRLRTDLSLTIFINAPEDYDGGELEIFSGYGPVQIKLPARAGVLYPSSTLHRVLPVTRGARLACAGWIESRVPDIARREVLLDLAEAKAALARLAPEDEATDRIDRAYANLTRLWTET